MSQSPQKTVWEGKTLLWTRKSFTSFWLQLWQSILGSFEGYCFPECGLSWLMWLEDKETLTFFQAEEPKAFAFPQLLSAMAQSVAVHWCC